MPSLCEKVYRLSQIGASYTLNLITPLGPPYHFAIEATNRCNFKCSYCTQSSPTHKDKRPVGNLSVDTFRIFIRQLKEVHCGNSHVSICLDGEPLLNKSFPDFIKTANEKALFPRFSSNARLLIPQTVDELSSFNFLAAIDFSSEPEVFESIRGSKGDFEIVLSNLRYLVDVATKHTHIQLELVDITHFSGHFDKALSLEKMRRLFPSNLPPNIRFSSRQFHNFGGYLRDTRTEQTLATLPIYRLCPYPWTTFSVTWDGNVVACCRDTDANTILGNVLDQSIMDIWKGEKYMEMRQALIERRLTDVAACQTCDMPYSAHSDRWRLAHILSALFRR